MARKRVAVLTNRNLLMAGVVTMLGEHSGLEVFTVATDDDELALKLSAFNPVVVILDGEDGVLASRCRLESLLQSRTVRALAVASSMGRNRDHYILDWQFHLSLPTPDP